MDYFMFKIRPSMVSRYLPIPVVTNAVGNLAIPLMDLSVFSDFSRNYFN
jgi:hypothetical protein